jgi:hypothetical protein
MQVTGLAKSTLADRLNSQSELMPLVQARLDEVQMVRDSVEQLTEVQSVRSQEANWTINYNLVAWHGGQDAYKCAAESLWSQDPS